MMKKNKLANNPKCWLNALILIIFSLLIAVMVSACQPSQSNHQSILVEMPYARAVPPGTPASAVFMQLSNPSSEKRKLIKAESSIASVVELHTHEMNGGMMQMRQVDFIDIPAKGKTMLQPGGYHIMLIQLKKPLTIDDMIDLSLTFDNGLTLQLDLPVKEVQAGMHQKTH